MEILNTHLIEKSLFVNSPRITLRQIAREVAEKHGLSLDLMRSNRRLGPISKARFEYYYRAANETVKPLSEIGRFIRVDHTTVSYGMTRYQTHHNLPPPRGYRFKPMAKGAVARIYPLGLNHCDSRTIRDVDEAAHLIRIAKGLKSGDLLMDKLSIGCR